MIERMNLALKTPNRGLTDQTYQEVKDHFSETEIAQSIFTGAVINSWNRLTISVYMIQTN